MTFSIFPRIAYQTTSKISGEIVVKEQFGQCKLYVQGTLQSGGIIRNIWKKPLSQVTRNTLHVTRCLILGLGGGTIVQLIKQHCSNVKITAVELDPEIIKIGKRYFNLGEVENLEVIQADAFEWVVRKTPRRWRGDDLDSCEVKEKGKGFDLIIVDFYLGKKFPKRAGSPKFLENVRTPLSKNGIAIFNRLRSRGENLEGFEKKLRINFSSVEKVKATTNLFFICC